MQIKASENLNLPGQGPELHLYTLIDFPIHLDPPSSAFRTIDRFSTLVPKPHVVEQLPLSYQGPHWQSTIYG